MSVYKFKGVEEAAGTLIGSASTVGENCRFVRVINTAGATAVVTMATDSDVVIGSTTLGAGEVIYLNKLVTDKLFASAATVLLTPLDPPRG